MAGHLGTSGRARLIGRALLAAGLCVWPWFGAALAQAERGPAESSGRRGQSIESSSEPKEPGSRGSGKRGELGRGGLGGKEGGKKGEEGEEEGRLPAPFDPVMEFLNPARLHRRLEEIFDHDFDSYSDKPRAPEIPLAVFREIVRPLGALKYENQLNAFAGAFSRDAPSQQTMGYEYVFADWNAVRLEGVWTGGRPEAVGVGYQRTLGVGPQGNWVHGVTLVPEFSVQRRFAGGSFFYTIGWKPAVRSPWSAALTLGANRVFREAEAEAAGGEGGDRGPRSDLARAAEGAAGHGVWRPLLSLNGWYTVSPKWTVGIENDFLPSGELAEYVVLPHVAWRPVEHFFAQVGAGYYQLGTHGQATFMVRLNVLNASPRKARPPRTVR